MDEQAQMERASGGDEAAFARIVRSHTNALWRYAVGMLGDEKAAEEAVQDAFLKAHRGLDGYRGEGSVRGWLLTICSRVCVDRLRLKRLDTVPLEDREPDPNSPDLALRAALSAAIADLPLDERQAFVLVGILGHSREEAASIAGVPASTLRSRVLRARARLADALEGIETGGWG